jgi:hypothetical protein
MCEPTVILPSDVLTTASTTLTVPTVETLATEATLATLATVTTVADVLVRSSEVLTDEGAAHVAPSAAATVAASAAAEGMPLPKKPMAAFLQFKADQLGNKWQLEQARYVAAYEEEKARGVAKPKSAYFRFVDDQQLSRKWAEIDPTERKRYQDNFAALRKEYVATMAKYNEMYAAKALEAPPPPEKGRPAFLHYVAEMRGKHLSELQGKKQQEINTILGKMWTVLPEADKQAYEQMAQRERDTYESALAAYQLQWGTLDYIKQKKKEASDENEDGSDEDDAAAAAAASQDDEDSADQDDDNDGGEEGEEEEEEEERPRKKARPVTSKRSPAAESNPHAGRALYCRHMLESELNKFAKKALRGKTPAPNLSFDCDGVVGEINQRWEQLSSRTQQSWHRRVAGTNKRKRAHDSSDDEDESGNGDDVSGGGSAQESDSDASAAATGDDDDEEEDPSGGDDDGETSGTDAAESGESGGEDDDDEDNEEDEDDDGAAAGVASDEEREESKKSRGKAEDIVDDEEDSRIGDNADYGDDGDDFVCGDDEIEYEEGVTSEDIRQIEEKQKAMFAGSEMFSQPPPSRSKSSKKKAKK